MAKKKNGVDKRRQELLKRMDIPSKRRQRGGTPLWLENHKDRELIEELIAVHARRHLNGGGLSHDEFVERVLRPEFAYPYEGAAIRTYVLKNCS